MEREPFKRAEVCCVMLEITTLISVVIYCNRVCSEEGPFEIERVNKRVRKADSIAGGVSGTTPDVLICMLPETGRWKGGHLHLRMSRFSYHNHHSGR
ncbi:hypothetical protein TNCT_129151 [Trichonephila clavata]|uniref:Uncharacterized protein n=1 Tax=Trichonephila clavata TaxID=2740835 RepID=A0A8X6FNI8_TRICU|nr:hypothetical protein TNCT_129151 [Trichonephila clavata]